MVEGAGYKRVIQRVEDVSDADQLIRFALAAQLNLLDDRGIPQAQVAKTTGPAKSRTEELSRILRGTKSATDNWLWELDEAIVALAGAAGGGEISNAGGLTSLAVRLRGVQDPTALVAKTPPGWTRELLDAPTSSDFGVLIRASALLAAFGTTRRAPKSIERMDALRTQYGEKITEVTKQLILIGASPPTSRHFDALIMLGSLGRHAFNLVDGQLETALRESPLGFRVWRAYTKLVLLAEHDRASSSPVDSPVNRALQAKVRALLTTRAKGLREKSLYPGRSLDLELAIAIPHKWSAPGDDWVRKVLEARAGNRDATLRERCTAAHGLWQRAYQSRAVDDDVRERVLKLIEDFRNVEPKRRPDIASGLEWGAATLKQVTDQDVATCNEWPDPGRPWFAEVNSAAESLNRTIPDHILPGAKSLFRHALLQNAGVERRRAIDTLVAGGNTGPIIEALGNVLEAVGEEDVWLRIRAIFAVGFLQTRTAPAVLILANAFRQAQARAMRPEPLKAHLTELHAALFAIGDCLGVPGRTTDDLIGQLRDGIEGQLRTLAESEQIRSEPFYFVARAMAYMLTVTALPRSRDRSDQADLSQELLQLLAKHPDEITSKLSRKALDKRFRAPYDKVPTILEAPPW